MRFIDAGFVANTLGLAGNLKLKVAPIYADSVERCEFLLLSESGGVKPTRSLKVESVQRRGGCLVVKASGVSSIDEASKLKGLKVLLPETCVSEDSGGVALGESGGVYWRDIENARVVDENGVLVGKLVDYLDVAAIASDVFRIELESGGYALISCNENHVLKIDAEKKEIVVNTVGLVSED